MANWYVNQKNSSPGGGTTPGTAFLTVKEAIASANTGDVVNVSDGEYFEKGLNLGAITDISLIGNNPESTIIDIVEKTDITGAQGVDISITNIQLKNLLFGDISVCEISNCILLNCDIQPSSYTYITSSIISNSSVYVDESQFNTVDQSSVYIFDTSSVSHINNVFSDAYVSILNNTQSEAFQFTVCNKCYFRFTDTASFVICNSATQLGAKRNLDLSTSTPNNWYDHLTFLSSDLIFQNATELNYTLKETLSPLGYNPVSSASEKGFKAGLYDTSINWIYSDFSTDPEEGGAIVGGLYKAFGSKSVFTGVAKSFSSAREVCKMPIFGRVFGNSKQLNYTQGGSVVCGRDPGWFDNRRVTVQWAFSATLSAVDLDSAAGVSVPYLQFLTNKKAFYVENNGFLVGNGDPAYDALVTAGAVEVPVVAKSFKPILTIVNE